MITRGTNPRRWLAVSILLVLTAALTPRNAAAQAPAPDAPDSFTQEAPGIPLSVGHSTVFQAPWPIRRLAITDPRIADVQQLTPRQVWISGKAAGVTDVLLWSADEERPPLLRRVEVSVDVALLKAEVAKMFPGSHLDLRLSNNIVTVNGQLSRAEDEDDLHKFLEAYGLKYVNMTRLAGSQQVQIKVLLAEANRTAIRALGVNAFETGPGFLGALAIGPDGSPLNSTSIGVPTGSAANVKQIPFQFLANAGPVPSNTLYAGFPNSNLMIFVQALEENQYIRVLAQPSLVSLTGQQASFLVGGEIPIPTFNAGAGASSSSIGVTYTQYGVQLHFYPIVLGDGDIRLHIVPEVSQIDTSGTGSIQIQGFSIPALLTRKAETTLELHSGQTFAMAGLIQNTAQATNASLPLLGDLPILGALFRSVRYQEGDTELVLLVTASIVDPVSTDREPMVPGGLNTPPTDWELYAQGRLNGRTAPRVAAADAQWMQETGLNRLRGPGAWATYDAPPGGSEAPLQSPAAGVNAPATPAHDETPMSAPASAPSN